MVEFIHTSDWHLGNPFSTFTEDQKQHLAEARFDAVNRLFEYARRESIPLLLCAGDQIDNGELRDTGVLLRLFGIISRFPEIQVVMISGNHDPYSPGSIYTRVDASSRPANLLFLSEPQVVELSGLGVRIYAAPLTKRHGRTNPIIELAAGSAAPAGGDAAGAGSVTIGLAHGSLAVSDTVGGDSDAFPIPPALAAEAGLDYLALGDWHSYLKSGDRTYYPGTHEPLAFGDDAGALRVRIERPGERPRVTRVETTVMQWREVERVLTDDTLASFLDSLAGTSAPREEGRGSLGPLFEGTEPPPSADASSAAGSLVSGGAGAGGHETILKLVLTGYLGLERFKQLEEGLSMAEGGFFRVFREQMPMVRPSGEEIRSLAVEGYMKRVLERLVALGEEGEEAAEPAMVRLYEFFHARGGGAKS